MASGSESPEVLTSSSAAFSPKIQVLNDAAEDV